MPSDVKASASAPKGLNERTNFFGMCLTGKVVSVKTTDGSSYKGLFFGLKDTESGGTDIVLSHAAKDGQPTVRNYAYTIIPDSFLASLSAEEIDLAGRDIAATPFHATSRFEDSSIANDTGNVRQLQPFDFAGEDASGALEDAQGTAANGWSGNDMFAENERRFGITATFEESMYTTAIDNANISAEEAQRIADSILAQSAATAHEREERGFIDDSGLSEEDKYGAVLRQVPTVPQKGAADETSGNPSRAVSGSPTSDPAPLTPPGLTLPSGNAALHASSKRVEMNAVHTEGKSLQTAVPAELCTMNVNTAPEAMSLMPECGASTVQKASHAATSTDATSSDVLAAAPVNGGGTSNPIAASDGAHKGGAAAPPFRMNPHATPFQFNPKSAPFVPAAKKPVEVRVASMHPSRGTWRPPTQPVYMYGSVPGNMLVPQVMQRSGPRNGGWRIPQGMPAFSSPNGQVLFSPCPMAVQGFGMLPSMGMAPGLMMQHAVC